MRAIADLHVRYLIYNYFTYILLLLFYYIILYNHFIYYIFVLISILVDAAI